MKNCPDCAESIQDAARVCRFCGYRYAEDSADDVADGAGEAAAAAESPAVAPARAAAAVTAPGRWGFLLTAVGGAAVFVAAMAGAVALCGVEASVGRGLAIANFAGFVGGGAALALGWTLVTRRGEAAFGGIVAGIVLVAGQLAALTLAGTEQELVRNLVTTVAMLVCLFLHLGPLEAVDFGGTRLAAMLSLLGFGGLLFSFVKQWSLPGWVVEGLNWCAGVGLLLFGLSLAVASVQRVRES